MLSVNNIALLKLNMVRVTNNTVKESRDVVEWDAWLVFKTRRFAIFSKRYFLDVDANLDGSLC